MYAVTSGLRRTPDTVTGSSVGRHVSVAASTQVGRETRPRLRQPFRRGSELADRDDCHIPVKREPRDAPTRLPELVQSRSWRGVSIPSASIRSFTRPLQAPGPCCWRQARPWCRAGRDPPSCSRRYAWRRSLAWPRLSDTGSRGGGADVRIVAASVETRQRGGRGHGANQVLAAAAVRLAGLARTEVVPELVALGGDGGPSGRPLRVGARRRSAKI
jgi:hypothetical protein